MPSSNTEITDKLPYRFGDLVDVPAFARLLESFFRATGIPNGVVDASGELLSLSAGENACTLFHRAAPKSAERCRESNLDIMRDLRDGCVAGGLCRNGLMDYATPVVIEGRQMATLFLGQVLHAPPDMAFFRAQAAEFGYDEKSYLESIAAIPVIDKARLENLMAVMVEMAQMLAASGLAKLRQAAPEQDANTHREREIQLEDILDFSPVAIGWSAGETRIEYVNRQFTQLFGYTLDDLPDMETWYRLAYPDACYRETVVRPWREAVALARRNGTQPPELEADVTCKDGTVRHMVIRAAWIGNRRMVGFTDITERKRMEQALSAREREFHTLAQNLPDVVVRYDHDARFVYANQKFETMLGIRSEDVRGKTPTQVPGLPEAEFFEREVRKVAETGMAVELEHEVVTADGRAFWGLVHITPELDDAGKVKYVQVVTRDITERWRIENALRSSQEMLADAQKLALLGSWDWNIVDDQVAWSEMAYEIYTPDKRPVKPGFENFKSSLYPDDLEKVMAAVQSAFESDTPFDIEHRVVSVSKGVRTVHAQGKVFRDASGKPVRMVGTVQDISERKQREARGQARNAMLEMVAQGAKLPEILNAIVRHMESEDKASLCSILLLDEEGKHLLTGAAPSLPAFYTQAIHGIEIGVGVGSCGTAAALGQRVVVEDIPTHECWAPYAKLAQEAGLRACWSEPILSAHGKVLGTCAIYHAEPRSPQAEDIERIAFAANLAAIAIENRSARAELERRAYTDYLTGLANRRHFLEKAEKELARTVRYGRELSILMLDVDHFKQVNDTYGHKVGDLVLTRLAELCRATLRDVDVVGRIGGEEFAVLLPETGSEQAMEAAERLRGAIATAQVTLGGGLPLRFTASFGVTTLREKDVNIDMLLNQADQALYQAKKEGRNRVHSYPADNENH